MDGYRRNHRNTPKTSRNIQIHRIKNIAATLRRRDRKRFPPMCWAAIQGPLPEGNLPSRTRTIYKSKAIFFPVGSYHKERNWEERVIA